MLIDVKTMFKSYDDIASIHDTSDKCFSVNAYNRTYYLKDLR